VLYRKGKQQQSDVSLYIKSYLVIYLIEKGIRTVVVVCFTPYLKRIGITTLSDKGGCDGV